MPGPAGPGHKRDSPLPREPDGRQVCGCASTLAQPSPAFNFLNGGNGAGVVGGAPRRQFPEGGRSGVRGRCPRTAGKRRAPARAVRSAGGRPQGASPIEIPPFPGLQEAPPHLRDRDDRRSTGHAAADARHEAAGSTTPMVATRAGVTRPRSTAQIRDTALGHDGQWPCDGAHTQRVLFPLRARTSWCPRPWARPAAAPVTPRRLERGLPEAARRASRGTRSPHGRPAVLWPQHHRQARRFPSRREGFGNRRASPWGPGPGGSPSLPRTSCPQTP